MFELFEKVRIKNINLPGTIVDISNDEDKTTFVVESDVKGKREDGYGGDYPLYWCKEDEIEKIS